MEQTKITVLISSCDAYSILWDDFEKFFKKHWHVDCDVILVSETKINSSFKTITPGKNSWGYRNLEALKEVKTELVFWLLDDYFLCGSFSKKNINTYIKDFIKLEMDRLQISPRGVKKKLYSFNFPDEDQTPKFSYKKILCDSEYSISMQPSIWRKSYITKILKPHYSPWQFEVEGSKLNYSNKVYIDESINFHSYFNAVRKKNIINISRIIAFLDKIIEKLFYDNLPFKFSKGYKKFMKNQSPKK